MEDCNKTDDDDDNDGFRNDHGRQTRNWYVFCRLHFHCYFAKISFACLRRW